MKRKGKVRETFETELRHMFEPSIDPWRHSPFFAVVELPKRFARMVPGTQLCVTVELVERKRGKRNG